MPKKIAKEWKKPLSNAAKAEMLAATFHLFTDHMPKEFAKLPKWLRSQMRQTMYDCSVDHRDLTKEDIKVLIEYGQWLNARYPQTAKAKLVLSDYAVEAGIESVEFRDGEKLIFKPKSRKK